MTLILPVGPPGCGKSTLGEVLINHLVIDEDAVVSPDSYRRILTGNAADQTANSHVFPICHAIARGRMQHGLPVYFDATNYMNLNNLSTIASLAGARVVCVRFSLDRSTVHARNELRSKPVPRDIVDKMFDDFMSIPLKDYPGITITPSEAAAWSRDAWK